MSTRCCAPFDWPPACASRPACRARRSSPRSCPTVTSRACARGCVTASRSSARPSNGRRGPTRTLIDESHTTSFSIADSDGNVVCLTQSLGSVFGSGVVVPGTGLCLNNFLYWADVNPDSPNRVTPGGPLPMCMAPSIVTKDDAPVLALGTPGSYGILQTQPQALVQYLDFGLPLAAGDRGAARPPDRRPGRRARSRGSSRTSMPSCAPAATRSRRVPPGRGRWAACRAWRSMPRPAC